jgi:hypothetical protein
MVLVTEYSFERRLVSLTILESLCYKLPLLKEEVVISLTSYE